MNYAKFLRISFLQNTSGQLHLTTGVSPENNKKWVPEREFRITAWKVFKYEAFSSPYFPAFGLNTEIYSVNFRNKSEYKKIRTRKKFVFGQFSRSGHSSICEFYYHYSRND